MSQESPADRPFFLRVFEGSNRLQARFADLPRILFQGLWLGLLSRERLARLDEFYYGEAQANQPDYAGDGHNLRGLFDWESAAVARHFPRGGRVVVTGAGGGRELVWFLQQGYDAVGYEPHPQLVTAGRELLRGRDFDERLHPCDRDRFPTGATPCDAVIVGWCSYMLIPGRSRRVGFLRGARAVLSPGAPLLVSFAVREPGQMLFHEVARLANVARRLRRDELVEAGDMLSPNFIHHFTRDELAAELSAAGFQLETFEREPYGHAVARAT